MTTALSKQDKTAVVKAQNKSPLIVLGARFDMEPGKLIDVLRGTVIKPDKHGKAASNEEVAAFCIVANQYGLNPFTREIHAFTSGEKGVVPIVGVDGWCTIVNKRHDFDGCDFDEIADDKGNPIAVTCRMHVKGRDHAVSVTERFSECKRATGPWGQHPWRMLRHKAFIQAARYAFGLSGIYDEDEARDIQHNATSDYREPIAMPTALPVAAPTEQQPIDVTPSAPTQGPLPDGMQEIRGVLESLTSKEIAGGKTKFDATINDTRYGFFDKRLAAEIEPMQGEPVIATVKASGKYWNLIGCEPDMEAGEKTEQNPDADDPTEGDNVPF